jgi:glycosyltransferase involved in cell wall biosynthesis
MNASVFTAVMPCRNEARTIGVYVREALHCFRTLGIEDKTLVVDGGSTDGSVEISCSAPALSIRRRKVMAALMRGIDAARGGIVIMADADDFYDWSDMAVLIGKSARFSISSRATASNAASRAGP